MAPGVGFPLSHHPICFIFFRRGRQGRDEMLEEHISFRRVGLVFGTWCVQCYVFQHGIRISQKISSSFDRFKQMLVPALWVVCVVTRDLCSLLYRTVSRSCSLRIFSHFLRPICFCGVQPTVRIDCEENVTHEYHGENEKSRAVAHFAYVVSVSRVGRTATESCCNSRQRSATAEPWIQGMLPVLSD